MFVNLWKDLFARDKDDVPPAVLNLLDQYGLALIPLALGAVAVFLLLPRARRTMPVAGILVALATAIVAVSVAWAQSAGLPLTTAGYVDAFLFWAFGGLAVLAGVLLVTQRNPARGAMAFAVVVLSSCGLFLLQAAPFLAAATVIIYAGAIIVTFLFVLMLSQQAGLSNANDRSREPFLAVGFGFLLVATLYLATQSNYQTAALAELAVEADRARQAATASSQFEAAKLLGEPVNDFLMRALGTEEGAWDPIREADRRRLVDPVKAAGAAFVAARPDEKISDALEKLDGLDSWWETAERLAQLVSAVTSRPADPARDELLAKATASMKEADERFWKLAQERLRGLAREGSRDRWETGRLAPTPPLAMSDATRVGVVELIERLEKFTPKETPDATKDDFMDRVLFFRDGIFPEKDKETWPPGADKFVNAVSEAYTPIRRRQEFTDATRTLLRRAADTGRPLLRSSSPSSASGLPSNTPYEKVPLGRDGRPAVPAANVAAVGRSLFTDYLLAVEMGGTLLLVATIGAIAITARRSEGPA